MGEIWQEIFRDPEQHIIVVDGDLVPTGLKLHLSKMPVNQTKADIHIIKGLRFNRLSCAGSVFPAFAQYHEMGSYFTLSHATRPFVMTKPNLNRYIEVEQYLLQRLEWFSDTPRDWKRTFLCQLVMDTDLEITSKLPLLKRPGAISPEYRNRQYRAAGPKFAFSD